MVLYEKFLDKLSKVMQFISVISLVFLVSLNAYEIAGRYLFHKSNYWIQDVSLFLMMWFLFTGIVKIIYDDQDIWVDILVNALPERGKTICSFIVNVISLLFNIALLYCSFSLMMVRHGKSTITAGIPTGLYTLATAVSCFCLCLIFIRNLIRLFSKGQKEAET